MSYGKFVDIVITLRILRERLHTYSAGDIKKLVERKSKSKKTPAALQQLYALEAMIADLRATLEKEEVTASETATLIEPTLPPNPCD